MQICCMPYRPLRALGFALTAALWIGLTAAPPAAAQPSPRARLLMPQDHGAPSQLPTGSRYLPRRDQLVESGIYRLDGVDASLPQNDLQPLRHILEGAQVVGLGESFHTSGGYYAMKHRLFRFMVEEMGFRAFAMETPWHYAQVTGQYVATCQGSVNNAMRYIFGVWASTETGALLEYMCSWNQQHPDDPITFFGFDTQQPEADGPALISFLQANGVAAGDPRIAAIRRCDSVVSSPYPNPVSDADNQACLVGLDAADQLLTEMDGTASVQSSREDVEWAKIRAIGLRAWQGQAYWETRDFPRAFSSRDRGMASALQRIRKLLVGSQKTAVWAHNFHIAKGSLVNGPYQIMGDWLEQELGHRYANVALIAYHVELEWPWIGYCGTLNAFPQWSTEWYLQPLGEPYLLVDLDFNGTNAAHPSYIDPMEWLILGYDDFILGEQFDALIYMERSRAMTPVYWQPCHQS